MSWEQSKASSSWLSWSCSLQSLSNVLRRSSNSSRQGTQLLQVQGKEVNLLKEQETIRAIEVNMCNPLHPRCLCHNRLSKSSQDFSNHKSNNRWLAPIKFTSSDLHSLSWVHSSLVSTRLQRDASLAISSTTMSSTSWSRPQLNMASSTDLILLQRSQVCWLKSETSSNF